jgi:hypothetical protein
MWLHWAPSSTVTTQAILHFCAKAAATMFYTAPYLLAAYHLQRQPHRLLLGHCKYHISGVYCCRRNMQTIFPSALSAGWVVCTGTLPGDALGHALLLKPSLLPHLLSDMACAAAEASSGGTPLPDKAGSSTRSSTTYNSSSSSGGGPVCAAPWSRVNSQFPGAKHLPAILAQQPYLLLLVRHGCVERP